MAQSALHHHHREDILHPLIYASVKYPDYGVGVKTGTVYSFKRTGWGKPMSPNTSGNSPYPKVGISRGQGPKTIMVHKAVHETLNPDYPTPSGVTAIEWALTPCSVKGHFSSYWQVNHKNHKHTDYSPDNLEWTSPSENVDAYHSHRIEDLE